MDAATLKQLTTIAITAAQEAGVLIAGYCSRQLCVQEKATGSTRSSQVVTELDFKSQEIILKHIEPLCASYDFGLLTEERIDDGSRFTKEYFWCIDPLDGTLPFIEKRPGYAVSVALLSRDGVPLSGVVYDPVTDTTYHAIQGGGAFRNAEPWCWQPDERNADTVCDAGGAVMNACWVLDRAPAYFCKQPKSEEGGGCLWDYAATSCIFHELGAWVSDIYGNPLDLNSHTSVFMNRKGVLYASSAAIAKRIVKDGVL